jgi:hypothetical protein
MVLWFNIMLHTLNLLITLVNLCGYETKLFNCNMVCGISMFQISIFCFMQFVYFEAQDSKCMTAAPDLYFWLMFQILIIWVAAAIIVCHFFRKYCQEDPVDTTKIPVTDPTEPTPGGGSVIGVGDEEDFLGHDPKDVHDFKIQLNNIEGPIFNDKEFPPNDSSIYKTQEGRSEFS